MTGEALTSTTDNLKPSSKVQGVAYVGGNESYISEDIDVEVIQRYDKQNYFYGRSKKNQHNLIFPNPYVLTAHDPDGEIDEDVTADMIKMCSSKDVNLWLKMQMAYDDAFDYGPALFNPVWKYKEGTYTLSELNHLPAPTFDSSPGGAYKVSSELLPGIGIDEKGQIHFWQNNLDGQPVELTNIVMIKDPMGSGVTGTPLSLPILPLIAGAKFAMNSQMQKVNRVGAPTPFIRLNQPKPASAANDMMSDVDYAQVWLKNFSKDILMPLRENMEIVDSYMPDNGSAIETIEYLDKMMVDYWSPSSMIAKDGTLIGGSSASELGLLMRYISSVHEWLENAFEELMQVYLDANGYEGYTVRIEIPEPEIDTTELDLKRAEIAKNHPDRVKANEWRLLMGWDELEELKDEWLGTAASPVTPFMNTAEKPTPKQAEKESEKEQKDAWRVVTDEVLDAITEDEE